MNASTLWRVVVPGVCLLGAGRALAQPTYGVSASGSALSFLADIPNDYHTYNQPFVQQLSYSNSIHSHLEDSYTFPCPDVPQTGDHASTCDVAGSVSMGLFSGTANATLSRSPVTYTCDGQTITNGASSQAVGYASIEFDDTLTLTSSTLPAGTLVPFRITVVADGSLTQGNSAEYTSPEYTPQMHFYLSTNYFNPGVIDLTADKHTGFFNGTFTTDTQRGIGSSFGVQSIMTYGMSTFYLESGFGSAATDERVNRIAVYIDPLVAGVHISSASGHDYSSQPATCNPDFNGDGDVGTDADIEAFFACLAGDCCATCGSADFNGDGDVGTDADIESFFRVLAGGSC